MPLLEIEDDVYQYLLRRAMRIGEDGSSILRRELGLPQPGTSPDPAPGVDDATGQDRDQLTDFLASPGFTRHRTATDRYLAVLGHLARQHEGDFEKVLKIRGRKRRYFGRTRAEVEESGTSMYPRQIPGSGYWAMTNADTAQKRAILSDVLGMLGYDATLIAQAKSTID